MKPIAFRFAIVADQVGSRSGGDRVPVALDSLDDLDLVLAVERTAGDEIQCLADDPSAVVGAVTRLTRLEGWRVGIGVGRVEMPLPPSTRAARGDAYVAARTAIVAARRSPTDLSLVIDPGVGAAGYRELADAARDAESALWLLRSVLTRRSTEGWELMDLLDEGLTNAEAAQRLSISPSAVSQRLARAARQEASRGAELAVRLLHRVQAMAGARGADR